MVLVQNWPFFYLFNLGNIGQENVFYDILEQKTPLKIKSSKSRKIDIFPKGLVHGCGPKLAIFLPYFLGNISQENVFYDIPERKHAFLGYIINKFKKSKT